MSSAPANVRLDRLRTIVAGALPLAPIHDSFGVRLTSVRAGRCLARMPAELLRAQPDPRCAGPLLVLADAVLGVSISSTLAADRGITTLRLAMHTAVTGWPGSGFVHAAAAAGDVDDETGTSTGEVRDDDGRLLATFDTRCAVIPSPEHWLRGPLPPASGAPFVPLDVACTADSGRSRLHARPGPHLGNARGALQGGLLALYADLLLVPLLRPDSDDDEAVRHDLEVHYLRGAGTDPLTGRAELVHPGRRLRTGRAEVLDPAGRPVVTATALAYVAAA